MVFKNCKLNEFDRILSAESALPILKEGVELTGYDYELKFISRYSPAVETYYVSLYFKGLGILVNGKGTTEVIARASMFGEAAERIQTAINVSSQMPNLLPYMRYVMGEGRDLPSYRVAHESDFSEGDCISIKDFFRGVPHDEEDVDNIRNTEVGSHWAKGYSLIKNKPMYVPSKVVGVWNSSNGVSAGITVEEAIIQGASEVFERYAMRQLMLARHDWPIIPHRLFNDKIQALTEKVERNGFKVAYRDFSEGKGYPSIGAMIECFSEPIGRASRVVVSFGSSPNMNYAAERCITEYFQGWERKMPMLREVPVIPFSQWKKAYKLYDAQIFSFNGDLKYMENFTRESEGWESPEMNTKSYMDYLVKLVTDFGSDLVVLDMTKKWCGIPTVRVIVPGMSELLNVYQNYQCDEKYVRGWIKNFTEGYKIFDNWMKYAERFGVKHG